MKRKGTGMNPLKHGLSSAGVALIALALLAPSAVAGKAKPDLVVTEAAQKGQPYGFNGEPDFVGFSDATKNKGSARAARSSTALEVSPHPELERQKIRVASRLVGKLGPKRSDSESGSEEKFDFDIARGAYYAFVCADADEEVKESNEENNCRRIDASKTFYVLERIWSGSVSGSGPLAGQGDSATESWQSNDATFRFEQYLGGGVFSYRFSGTVYYQDTGTAGDCTYSSGSGANGTALTNGQLLLDYQKEQYNGSASTTQFYEIDQDCGFYNFVEPGPRFPEFLQTGTSARTKPLPFGTSALKDQNEEVGSGSGGSGTVTWHWDLQ